ncbi:HAD family phosphatase [Massilibacteroides sp.]|uniref:HAD family hydrolase n=1 Tax=Massilibacteroides sp. TaxID=2034766 RepID=UPI002604C9DB|nr:HAD family phosphatase [Massilibacteroides sp.]MDD4514371.1 HAD family phosphatase [Massilibacteroides sp.]
MINPKVALFDFDGVVVDTEPIYDEYWNQASVRYETGIENFAKVIKGTTLPAIIENHFADRSDDFKQLVIQESMEYERRMPLPPMPGSIEFLHLLKENGVRMGLVTSSDDVKVNRAFNELSLHGMFDSVVTADRINKGKPDPSCYLLAAKDFAVDPQDCIVFEDSFAGIQAGTDAGMRVIGLSTTNPKETLEDKVYQVIPDFSKVSFDDYMNWCKD